MDINVKNAVNAAIQQYAKQIAASATEIESLLAQAFDAEQPFMEKVAQMDQAFDDFPQFEALREVIFDLMMVNFFVEDSKNLEEDYLESEEWEAIEEKTLDRGTELLNMLLYINECKEESITPSLDDFLKEFLLIDEDEFQDEYHIYEDFITHQELVEANVTEVLKVKSQLATDSEVYELFVPMMAFFISAKWSEVIASQLTEGNTEHAFDGAIYALLTAFNQQ